MARSESHSKDGRDVTTEVPPPSENLSRATIYESVAHPETLTRLEQLLLVLNLEQDTSQQKRQKCLTVGGEIEKTLAILHEMETRARKKYAGLEIEMQTQFDRLEANMKLRMQKIQEHGDQTQPSAGDEKALKKLLNEGKAIMSEGEANLIDLEDRLGGSWTMVSLLGEALLGLSSILDIMYQFLTEERADFQLLMYPQNLALPGLQQMTKLLELITNKKLELAKLAHGHGVSTTGSSFAYFEKLPAELKHMVLEAAVPSPRVVTRRSEDILNDVLGANSLTRAIIKSRYSRIANPLWRWPKIPFPHSTTTYVNLKSDTVLKSVMIYDSERGPDRWRSLIERQVLTEDSGSFTSRFLRRFTGLSKIKHLALSLVPFAYTPALYPMLRVCCPELKTLTFCYNRKELYTRFSSGCDIQFLELDSNLHDYAWFKWDQVYNGRHEPLVENKQSVRSYRSDLISNWNYDVNRYETWKSSLRVGFHVYCEKYGLGWEPSLRVCLMTHVNANGCRHIFSYKSGRLARESFMDSLCLKDEEGNFLSRYDGIEELFREVEK